MLKYLCLLIICCTAPKFCLAQYYNYARISDLIILTDGGRIVTPPVGIKPYNLEVDEYVVLKMHVVSIIDKEKPYVQKMNQPLVIGQPAKMDSIEVLYHCCNIFRVEDCIRMVGLNKINSSNQVFFLKKTPYKKKYLHLNSFNADTKEHELNAIIQLGQIAHITKLDKIKNDK